MTKIEWTTAALDAVAVKLNGNGYLRFSVKTRQRIRDEVRELLDTAVAVQGVIVVQQSVVDLISIEDDLNG
jgi:hypothetical protein